MKNILAILALVVLLPSVAYSNTWKHGYYVDEFGDKTNRSYVNSTVTGKMTNTSTTDGTGRLEFFFGINARTRNSPNLEIRVFSHGRFPESFYEAKDIIAKVKHNGNVREIVVVYGSGESLMIHVKDAVWMWETLKSGGDFSISIRDGRTSYTAKVVSSNFKTASLPFERVFSESKSKAEEAAKQNAEAIAAAKAAAAKAAAEEKRKAEENRKAEEKNREYLKLNAPFLLRTANQKFEVKAYFSSSTETHVTIERVDNGKKVVVDKSILDAGTKRLILEKENLAKKLIL